MIFFWEKQSRDQTLIGNPGNQEQGLSQAISIAMREQCPFDVNLWMKINECVPSSRGVFTMGVLYKFISACIFDSLQMYLDIYLCHHKYIFLHTCI